MGCCNCTKSIAYKREYRQYKATLRSKKKYQLKNLNSYLKKFEKKNNNVQSHQKKENHKYQEMNKRDRKKEKNTQSNRSIKPRTGVLKGYTKLINL